jgi:hypothetical protein
MYKISNGDELFEVVVDACGQVRVLGKKNVIKMGQ